MHVVFDLDGVLLGSVEVVLEAYQRINIEPPDQDLPTLLGTSPREWIATQLGVRPGTSKMLKPWALWHAAYLRGLAEAGYYPTTYQAAHALANAHSIGVVTNAPRGALDVLWRRLGGFQPFTYAEERVSTDDTPAWLQRLGTFGGIGGVLVTNRTIAIPNRWATVPFTGQDVPTLHHTIVTAAQMAASI